LSYFTVFIRKLERDREVKGVKEVFMKSIEFRKIKKKIHNEYFRTPQPLTSFTKQTS